MEVPQNWGIEGAKAASLTLLRHPLRAGLGFKVLGVVNAIENGCKSKRLEVYAPSEGMVLKGRR